MQLTQAEKTALTDALLNLKIDPVHGTRLNEILALNPAEHDVKTTLWDYCSSPANPGGGTSPRKTLSRDELLTLLTVANLRVSDATDAVKAKYNQFVGNISGILQVQLADEGWAEFFAFCVTHNLLDQDRLDSFATVAVSLCEHAIGRVPTPEELFSVVYADDGTKLL